MAKTKWPKDTARLQAAGQRVAVLLRATQDAAPTALQRDVTTMVHAIGEPLAELEHVQLPEQVRAAGRTLRDVAEQFAQSDNPYDAVRDVHRAAWAMQAALHGHGNAMRDAARRATSKPAKTVELPPSRGAAGAMRERAGLPSGVRGPQ